VEAVQAWYAQTTIELEEAPEDEDEPDETARQAAVLQYVNVSDVLRETAELLLDDDLSSPLVQQLMEQIWHGWTHEEQREFLEQVTDIQQRWTRLDVNAREAYPKSSLTIMKNS
jgi:hypothetical protein